MTVPLKRKRYILRRSSIGNVRPDGVLSTPRSGGVEPDSMLEVEVGSMSETEVDTMSEIDIEARLLDRTDPALVIVD